VCCGLNPICGIAMQSPPADERLRRWRLILGGESADGTGVSLSGADLAIDNALKALYDAEADRARQTIQSTAGDLANQVVRVVLPVGAGGTR